MTTVAVIDYGMGNLHSVAKALGRVDASAKVTIGHDAATILAADRVVFPGVGALRDCMAALQERNLVDTVKQCALQKPFLGICLGMQALFDFSEENDGTPGLGIVPGRVRRFAPYLLRQGLKIPHMGWNEVNPVTAHPLWRDIPSATRFYFVHSYYVDPAEAKVTAAVTDYGGSFTCAIARDNLFAVQFHPEKSQRFGLQLLQNFLAWRP
jgi:glutamine amidotransferase